MLRNLAKFLEGLQRSTSEIRLLYLFGSYAEGRTMLTNDMDLTFVVSRLSIISPPGSRCGCGAVFGFRVCCY